MVNTILTFAMESGNIGLVILALLAYIVLNRKIQIESKANALRHEFLNKKLCFLDDTIENVINDINLKVSEINNLESKCPNNTVCSYASSDIDKQMVIFKNAIDRLFSIKVKGKVKNYILRNGFHHKSEVELQAHIIKRGSNLYDFILLEIFGGNSMALCGDIITLIHQHKGEIYTNDKTIKIIDNIFRECIRYEQKLDDQITKYKTINIFKRLD